MARAAWPEPWGSEIQMLRAPSLLNTQAVRPPGPAVKLDGKGALSTCWMLKSAGRAWAAGARAAAAAAANRAPAQIFNEEGVRIRVLMGMDMSLQKLTCRPLRRAAGPGPGSPS